MKQRWTAEELEDLWTLHPEELKLLKNKSGETRLSFAVMLKYFQLFHSFPHIQDINIIPRSIILHISKQIGVSEYIFNKDTFWSSASKSHRKQIRDFLDFRLPNERDINPFIKWLIEEVLSEGNSSFPYLTERSYNYFKQTKIEPFSKEKIERYIRSALHKFETNLFLKLSESISNDTKESLFDLVEHQEKQDPQSYYLRHLKQDAGNVSLASILEEVKKINHLVKINLPDSLFQGISQRILEKYKTRVMAETPSEIRDHKESVKKAMLAMFCYVRGQEITDSLVDLLIKVIHKIGRSAETKIDKKLISEIKKVLGKSNILIKLAKTTISNPEGVIKEVVYPVIPEETLKSIIKEEESIKSYTSQVYTKMRSSYSSHYRRMLAPILKTLSFQSNNDMHQPVLAALEILKEHLESKAIYYPNDQEIPIKGVIKPGLQKIILEKVEKNDDEQERVNRINYEISALKALRAGLRCKEIWVKGASRYRNPDEDLPYDFDERREEHYLALKQPLEAKEFTSILQQKMRSALTLFNDGMRHNTKVKILPKKNGHISLSPLEEQKPSPNLDLIKKQVFEKWKTIGLLDILKETDYRTDFTSFFTSTASREYLDSDQLKKRLLLCIFAYGTNTGLKRISASNPEVTYEDLRYIRRRYLTKTNLRMVISEVVNAILKERQEEFFGQTTTSIASDSKKFGVWDQNLLTEWHARYQGRGVMIYWHIDRKSALIYSQLKSCSSSEVSSMIEGVLRHCTDMKIEKGYVDSHGQSSIGFAFSYMLSFDLLPRIKAIHKEKLYLPETGTPDEYKNLQHILTRPIRWHLIHEQYDQIVKFTTALRLGTSDAESILRRFTSNNTQHPVYQALMELGKAVKTIFLCRYLHSEELRREIQEGLNVVESSNSVNDFILYGKGGEISTNRGEEQLLTMLCLHLLQNSLVYINTLMLQSVLSAPQWKYRLTSEDKRAITPLFYEHINPYGLFLIDLNHRIPLNKFEAANEQRITNAA